MKNNTYARLAFAFAILASGITGSALAGEAEVIRLSEPVEVTDAYEVFGSPLPESSDVLENRGSELPNKAFKIDGQGQAAFWYIKLSNSLIFPLLSP